MFTMPTEVHFGLGVIQTLPQIFGKKGFWDKKPFLVRGESSFKALTDRGLLKPIEPLLEKVVGEYSFSGEPTLKHLEEALRRAKESNAELIIAIGGGSPLDLGKAVAGLYFADPTLIEDYFYKRTKLPKEKLPFVAIPTTAGTGSEVTTVSVLIDPGKYKGSIGYRLWFPDLAFTDPRLTLTLNERYTLSSGLDALTHALEAVASTGADPLTMRLAWSAANTILEILPELIRDLENEKLRERMSWASLTAGLSFATSGLGLCHAIGHAIGLLYGVPHGFSVSALLPAVWRFNMSHIEEKVKYYLDLTPEDILKRLEKVYQALNYDPRSYPMGRDGAVKVRRDDLKEIIRITLQGKSYTTNPRPSLPEDIEKILEETFELV